MGNNRPISAGLNSPLAAFINILIPLAATLGWWLWNTHTGWEGRALLTTLVVYALNLVWIILTRKPWMPVLVAACGTTTASAVLGFIGFLNANIDDAGSVIGSGQLDIGPVTLPVPLVMAVMAVLVIGTLFRPRRFRRVRPRRQGKK